MMCLSIAQPWTWLIVNQFKTIENRTWRHPPTYRGPLLLHAGLKPDREFPWAWAERLCGQKLPPSYPLGGIVGQAQLVDVVRQSNDPWFVGPLGLVLADAQPLPFTPLRGQLGLFEVDARRLAPQMACINEETCGWTGPRRETVHPKHDPTALRCPECYEVVEEA